MEEVVLELRAAAEQVPVPLELPSDDDLLNVEEALLLSLPSDYRAFLSEVSDLVLGSLEPCTAADPQAHNYIPDLAAIAWDNGLPRHLIPVSVNDTCIYAITPEGEIEYWEDYTKQDKTWETVWEWARDVWLASAPL